MKTALIVCGALAREVIALKKKYNWDADLLGVPAQLHNHPKKIPASVQKRIEEFQSEQCFNCIVTRATFSISEMINKTQRLLCPDGCLLLMKGKYPTEELSHLDKSQQVIVHKLQVPGLNAERHLVCV